MRVGIATIWILLAAIALEFGLRVLTAWVEGHNPLILAHSNGQWHDVLPPDVLGAPLRVPPPALSWAESAPHPPLAEDWEMPRADRSDAEKRALWKQFPALNEADRLRFAIAHGLAVYRYDQDAQIQAVYAERFKRMQVVGWPLPMPPGSPLFLEDELAPEVRAALESQDAREVSVQVPSDWPDARLQLYVLPDGDACYVFSEMEQWFVSTRYNGTDLGTRYDTIDFSYRKNHDDGNDFVTNRHGFRAPEVSIPKSKDVFRILCIGGSTTAEGQDNASTYPALVQAELRAAFPGKHIEVLNYGVQGIRTRSQFLHLPTFLALEPDLVIGYLGVNDLRLDVPASFVRPGALFFETQSLVQRLTNWYLPWTRDTKQAWIDGLTLTNIESLRRIFAREGIRFALCSAAYPHTEAITRDQRDYLRYRHDATPYLAELTAMLNRSLEDYCDEQKLFYIPFDENFRAYELMSDWCHVSHQGKIVKADIIARCLHDYLAEPIAALSEVGADSAAVDMR